MTETSGDSTTSHPSRPMTRGRAILRFAALASYAWLLLSTISYGIAQSTSINAYGIQPGTPIYIEVLIAPAALVFYLAQFLTYGSVHVCGTFASPCAWPYTWPGPHPLENVDIFDDVWFTTFGLVLLSLLAYSRSLVRSIRAVSLAPIMLGAILFFDDNHWFYVGFSDELNMRGVGWLTNEGVMLIGAACFGLSTAWLWIGERRSRVLRPLAP